MEFRDYLRIMKQRGWIFVLLVIVTAGVAYGVSKMMIPTYQAQVYLTVRPIRPDWSLGSTTKDLLRSLAGDIMTHKFMQEVIDRGELDLTTDDLLDGKTVHVNAESSDFTIQVTVRDPDPEVAVQTVNLIADIFKEQRDAWNQEQDKQDRIDVQIRDYARTAPLYSPKTKINVLAGAVLGGLLGVLVIVVLEWLESGVVRFPEDLERTLGLPALGTIPVAVEEQGIRKQRAR